MGWNLLRRRVPDPVGEDGPRAGLRQPQRRDLREARGNDARRAVTAATEPEVTGVGEGSRAMASWGPGWVGEAVLRAQLREHVVRCLGTREGDGAEKAGLLPPRRMIRLARTRQRDTDAPSDHHSGGSAPHAPADRPPGRGTWTSRARRYSTRKRMRGTTAAPRATL